MESKGDGVLGNVSDAPEMDQTLTPTPDHQDQEGDGEGNNDKADDNRTITLLLDEIETLDGEKQELHLQLDDARRELLGVVADNRSLEAKLRGPKKKEEVRDPLEEELQQVVKDLEETKTRLEMELAGFRSQMDRYVEIQGEHDAAVAAMARGLNVSWLVVSVASIAAMAAMAFHHLNVHKR